jgi:hypothetical protein
MPAAYELIISGPQLVVADFSGKNQYFHIFELSRLRLAFFLNIKKSISVLRV